MDMVDAWSTAEDSDLKVWDLLSQCLCPNRGASRFYSTTLYIKILERTICLVHLITSDWSRTSAELPHKVLTERIPSPPVQNSSARPTCENNKGPSPFSDRTLWGQKTFFLQNTATPLEPRRFASTFHTLSQTAVSDTTDSITENTNMKQQNFINISLTSHAPCRRLWLLIRMLVFIMIQGVLRTHIVIRRGNVSPFARVRPQRWGKKDAFHQIPFLVNSKNRANVKIAVVTLGTGDLPSQLRAILHVRRIRCLILVSLKTRL
ncbi:hypothetical protein TNCV_674761 [Trichonephila clavipes]|nr:hypothetical protein TNCV_674761 [Trichonephila clavipes]